MPKPIGYYTSTGDHVQTHSLTHEQAIELIQAHAKRLKGKGKVPKELLDSKLDAKGVILWALQFLEN